MYQDFLRHVSPLFSPNPVSYTHLDVYKRQRHSMSMGDEIYAVNSARNGDAFAEAVQLTTENKQIYDQRCV